jgi:hypothetical protein
MKTTYEKQRQAVLKVAQERSRQLKEGGPGSGRHVEPGRDSNPVPPLGPQTVNMMRADRLFGKAIPKAAGSAGKAAATQRHGGNAGNAKLSPAWNNAVPTNPELAKIIAIKMGKNKGKAAK